VGGKEAGAGGTEYDYKHRNINNSPNYVLIGVFTVKERSLEHI
jgi:hypothetical protein